MHTLVQGLEDATTAEDVMEEYATNDNLQTASPSRKYKKYKKIIEAKESTKRSMAELTRAQEELHGTTNKLRDFHKSKSLELQKSRYNLRSNEGTPERSVTQPDSRPTCTLCNCHRHGSSRKEQQQGYRA